jgi:hypothetical protein
MNKPPRLRKRVQCIKCGWIGDRDILMNSFEAPCRRCLGEVFVKPLEPRKKSQSVKTRQDQREALKQGIPIQKAINLIDELNGNEPE